MLSVMQGLQFIRRKVCPDGLCAHMHVGYVAAVQQILSASASTPFSPVIGNAYATSTPVYLTTSDDVVLSVGRRPSCTVP
jgi:hypothetical protein